jgi:uncharacterized protein YndB with AHSA1/START domain
MPPRPPNGGPPVPDYSTSIDIAASPEVVFDHLVTPEGMLAWMGERAELDPTPGGSFAVDIGGTLIRGEYLEVDPHRRVRVSWGVAGSDEFPSGSSTVEFTLFATDTGTRLDLVHRDIPEARAAMHQQGWQHFLGRLRTAASGTDLGADSAAAAAPVEPGGAR